VSRGIFGPPIEQLTVDGYDLQFGTNVLGMYFFDRLSLSYNSDERSLGHFYFTKLLPALLNATRSSPGVGGLRVVNTTSVMHHFQDLNTFKDGPARKKMGCFRLYYQSKFVCHMIIATVELNFVVVASLTFFQGQCHVCYGDCSALWRSRNYINLCASRYEMILVSSKFKFTHQTQVQ
jgi:NAD(P)-dependent dehydrogenase (short-subunit alcohol dehydrogenase family)